MTESEAIKELHEIRPRGGIIPQKRAEAIDVAINALEKQIQKKPKERDCIGFNTLVCPECKMALYLYEQYCDNCGQAIDWSDEE